MAVWARADWRGEGGAGEDDDSGGESQVEATGWPFSVIKAGATNAHLDQQCVGVREEGQGRRGREGGRVL